MGRVPTHSTLVRAGHASRTADPVATAVLRAQPANVSWVLVDGKVRKRAGKLLGVDVARMRRLVRDSHTYILGLINSAGFDIHHG